MPSSVDPIDVYDRTAETFAEMAEHGLYNALCDRPAVLRLLGNVEGQTVLDLGCGPGLYAEQLVLRGAKVIGLDGSSAMIRLAKQRLGDAAIVVQHDLRTPLPLPGESIDAAVCALVLLHLDDRVALLREIRRVLKPAGRLVISTRHPFADWLIHGGNYFTVERVQGKWCGGDVNEAPPYWRMPLSVVLDETRVAGFRLDRLDEPRPLAGGRLVNPIGYDQLLKQPMFIALVLLTD